MNQLYKLFNVKSDREYQKIMEQLDLTPYYMFKIEDIANNGQDLMEQRQSILSLLALTTGENYNFCKKQFNRTPRIKKLKENINTPNQQSLTLNDIMELNDLIDSVAKKCQHNKMAYQQLYQMIVKSTNKNIANAFFNMAFNAQNTDDNLKFNTDLVINGQNVAQTIYPLKTSIISALNSIQEPKKEQPVTESVLNEEQFIDTIKNIHLLFHKSNNENELENIIKLLDKKIVNSKSTKEKNTFNSIKTNVIAKLNKLKENINECLTSNVVASAVEEDTFDGLLNSLAKPTVINITVNKETGDCENIETQPVLNNMPNKDLIDGVQSVQPLTLSPTAIDAPILQKPDSASVVSAISALSSHVNNVKSDSRENNIECLQTINTLLNQISTYFNKLLSESNLKFKKHNKQLIFENGLRKAGFLNIKTNEIIWLKQGENHSDRLTYTDFDNGWVRFGVAPSRKNQFCYISSTNKSFFLKAIKKLNKIFSDNIDYYELEYFTDDSTDPDIIKVDINGKTLWESKYSPVLPKNVKRMLESGRATVNNDGVLVIDEAIFDAREKKPYFIYTFKTPFDDYFEFTGYKIDDDSVDVDLMDADYNYLGTSEFSEDGAKDNYIKEYFIKNNLGKYWSTIEKSIINKIKIAKEDNQLDETIDSEKLFKNDDAIASLQNKIIKLKQKLNNRTSNKEEIMMRLSIAQSRLRKLQNKNEQLMNEETVFDHSWYENDDGDFPKRTKEGVIIEDEQVDETCSAGATCAGNVATISRPVGKKKKRKLSIDESLLLTFVKEGRDCTSSFNGHHYMLKNGYLYKDDQLVKTKNLNEMVEFIQGNIDLPILEGFLPMHLDMMLEDINNPNELSDMDLTPEQRQLKQKQEQNLDSQLNAGANPKVSVEDSKDTNKIETNQELVGVDDTDINNKQYVVKNPATNKIKIVKSNQIKTNDEQGI